LVKKLSSLKRKTEAQVDRANRNDRRVRVLSNQFVAAADRSKLRSFMARRLHSIDVRQFSSAIRAR